MSARAEHNLTVFDNGLRTADTEFLHLLWNLNSNCATRLAALMDRPELPDVVRTELASMLSSQHVVRDAIEDEILTRGGLH